MVKLQPSKLATRVRFPLPAPSVPFVSSMKTVPIILFLLGGLHFASAQSCRVDVITLKARISAQPEDVLPKLRDAIVLNPACLGELVEAAIAASDPSPDTLGQIIQLAVSEYPDHAAMIAESAVLAAPDQIEVIRNAFVAPAVPEEPSMVEAGEEFGGDAVTPIERYLAARTVQENEKAVGSEAIVPVSGEDRVAYTEVQTSRQSDPEDVATKAIRVIDEMLARLEGKEFGMPAERSESIEAFLVRQKDEEIAITTLNGSLNKDRDDESVKEGESGRVMFQDPDPSANSEPVNESEHAVEELKEVEVSVPDPMEGDAIVSSSVYPIPALEGDSELADSGPFMNRQQTISNTLPQQRP